MAQGRRVVQIAATLRDIGEACNGVEAVESFRVLKPELTTLDITSKARSVWSGLVV
jgi:AmiR/NasT family two-component response regulator